MRSPSGGGAVRGGVATHGRLVKFELDLQIPKQQQHPRLPREPITMEIQKADQNREEGKRRFGQRPRTGHWYRLCSKAPSRGDLQQCSRHGSNVLCLRAYRIDTPADVERILQACLAALRDLRLE